jgi:MSHA biogenesis protein MshG
VLDRISNLLEKETVTAAKVKSATRYPLIVLCALAVAFAIMMVYVIPRFASFFSALKGQLPLPTRILIGTNAMIVGYWYWLIGAAVVVVYVLRKYLETEQGRYNWDRLMLSLPVFGTLFVKLYLSRFGRMLGAMLNSGIPVLEALTVTAATVENKVIARVIIDIRNDVAQGKSLTEPMKGSKVFPPIAVSMVAIGEKAGTLEKMLDKMADYFDREVDYTIDNLTPLLEPLLIVGLGVILMIFALGIFLPMWEMVNLYKQ